MSWQRITLRNASALAWPVDVGLLTPLPTVIASRAVTCFRTWPLGVLHCRLPFFMSFRSSELHKQYLVLGCAKAA